METCRQGPAVLPGHRLQLGVRRSSKSEICTFAAPFGSTLEGGLGLDFKHISRQGRPPNQRFAQWSIRQTTWTRDATEQLEFCSPARIDQQQLHCQVSRRCRTRLQNYYRELNVCLSYSVCLLAFMGQRQAKAARPDRSQPPNPDRTSTPGSKRRQRSWASSRSTARRDSKGPPTDRISRLRSPAFDTYMVRGHGPKILYIHIA